jgi:hypothetical protein
MSSTTTTTTTSRRWVRWALGLAGLGLLTLTTGGMLMVAGGPASSDPGGNNGTVKIVELTGPANDPHVPCTFTVEWYGFDANATSDVVFELQNPTAAGRTLAVTAGDLHVTLDNDGNGDGLNLDARMQYTLAFTGDPQPQQGYHVKMTATTTGSRGNDTKSKVFWVDSCGVVPTTGPTETTTGEPVLPPTTGTPGPSETPEPTDELTTAPAVVPGPDQEVPTVVDAGLTGWSASDVWGAGLVGAGLTMVAGAAVIALGARRVEAD